MARDVGGKASARERGFAGTIAVFALALPFCVVLLAQPGVVPALADDAPEYVPELGWAADLDEGFASPSFEYDAEGEEPSVAPDDPALSPDPIGKADDAFGGDEQPTLVGEGAETSADSAEAAEDDLGGAGSLDDGVVAEDGEPLADALVGVADEFVLPDAGDGQAIADEATFAGEGAERAGDGADAASQVAAGASSSAAAAPGAQEGASASAASARKMAAGNTATLAAAAQTYAIEPKYTYYFTNRNWPKMFLSLYEKYTSDSDVPSYSPAHCVYSVGSHTYTDARRNFYVYETSSNSGYLYMRCTYNGNQFLRTTWWNVEDSYKGICTETTISDDKTPFWKISAVSGAWMRVENGYHTGKYLTQSGSDGYVVMTAKTNNQAQWKPTCTTTIDKMRSVNISGTAGYNQTLTASLNTHLWGSSLKYQWKRNGSNISGATSSTYKTVEADIGKNITCTITDANGIYTGSVTSAAKTIAKPTYTQTVQVRYQNADGTYGSYSNVINKAYAYGDTVSWSRKADGTYKAASVSYTVGLAAQKKQVSVDRQSYYLDVNGLLDGSNSGSTGAYGTFDIAVNGKSAATGVNDYYKQSLSGSKYVISNVKAKSGYTYDGVAEGALNGTLGTANQQAARLKFHTNTYSVTFDGNGADGGSMKAQGLTCHAAKALTKCGFTRTGYRFAGWNTKRDGSGTAYADGASVKNLTLTDGAKFALYAQWERETLLPAAGAGGWLFPSGATLALFAASCLALARMSGIMGRVTWRGGR